MGLVGFQHLLSLVLRDFQLLLRDKHFTPDFNACSDSNACGTLTFARLLSSYALMYYHRLNEALETHVCEGRRGC